jgi:heme-binding NEAT domain protein
LQVEVAAQHQILAGVEAVAVDAMDNRRKVEQPLAQAEMAVEVTVHLTIGLLQVMEFPELLTLAEEAEEVLK